MGAVRRVVVKGPEVVGGQRDGRRDDRSGRRGEGGGAEVGRFADAARFAGTARFGDAARFSDAARRGGPAVPREKPPAAPGQAPERRPAGRTMLPAAGLPRRSRDELLASARRGLAEAALAHRAGERYALAHLAALRVAAAVLADRAQPRPGHRGRPASAWRLLAVVAPELEEWAAFFAAGAGRRAAAEAGLAVVSTREADDLVRQTELFLGIVEAALGVPSQPPLPPAESPEARTWH